MVRFVHLTREAGSPIHLNPAQVIAVEPVEQDEVDAEALTRIFVIGSEEGIMVRGDVADVLDALESAPERQDDGEPMPMVL